MKQSALTPAQFVLTHGRRGRSKLGLAGLLLAIVFGCAFVGLLLALGGSYAALFVMSVVLFIAGMLVPLNLLVLVIFAVVYLVVGQLQYFARIDKAFWIPYLLGLFLYLRLLADGLQSRPRGEKGESFGGFVFVCVALFFAAAAASSLMRGISPIQWIVAGKEYFFLWSIFFAFLTGALKPAHLERMLRFVPWFLALQVPAVVYQRFVVSRHRADSASFDSVVGLFGGDPNGGGASGAMAIFGLIAIAFMVEGWRANKVSGRRTLATVLFATVSIVFAEVKFALILLPVLALLLFGRQMLRQPGRAIAGLLLGAVLTVGLLAAYQAQFTSGHTRQSKSLEDYVDTMIERNTGTDYLNLSTGEIGRVAAFAHWWNNQSRTDPTTTLIGSGMGSTRAGALVVGELVKRYHFKLGRSTLVLYLWEIGVLGTAAILLVLLASVLAGFRLARSPALAERSWMLRGSAVGLILVVLGLPYNTDFADVAQMQVLTFALIGFIVVSGRNLPRRGAARATLPSAA